MKKILIRLFIIISFLLLPFTTIAQELDPHNDSDRQFSQGWKHAAGDLKYELGALTAGVAYLGLKEWKWGSSSFRINDENWFGMNTGSGGADKLGHLYSAYAMSEFLTHRLNYKTAAMDYSAKYGAIYSWGMMLIVEIFDGVSMDHGFSYEDLIMNSTGIAASYLKNTVPWLKDKFDLRVEYLPSDGMKGFYPVTDYSGMKYIAALKLNGFDNLRNTPLKYLELHLGYYTRGFKDEDRNYFDKKKTNLYLGFGLNLEEFLFKKIKKGLGKPADYLNTFFKYYQAPYTYIECPLNKRTASE